MSFGGVDFCVWAIAPSFCNHVGHIICVGPGPEMSGVNAGVDITSVANEKSRRNGAANKSIGVSVSRNHFPLKPKTSVGYRPPAVEAAGLP